MQQAEQLYEKNPPHSDFFEDLEWVDEALGRELRRRPIRQAEIDNACQRTLSWLQRVLA